MRMRLLSPGFVIGWIALTVLCSLRTLTTPESEVHLIQPLVVPSITTIPISPQNVPGMELGVLPERVIVSEWLATFLAATLISLFVRCLLNGESLVVTSIIGIAMALVWSPERLVLWCWMFLQVLTFRHPFGELPGFRRQLVGLTILVGGYLTCLDFVLLAALFLGLSIDRCLMLWRREEPLRVVFRACIGAVALLFAVGIFSYLIGTSFTLNPQSLLNAVTFSLKGSFYTELQPIFYRPVECLILAAVMSGGIWYSLRDGGKVLSTPVTLFVFATLAVLCREYLSVAVLVCVGCFSVIEETPESESSHGNHFSLTWLTIPVGATLLALWLSVLQVPRSAFFQPFQERLVDFRSVDRMGTVLSTSPSHVTFWTGAKAPSDCQLVLTDRWDDFSVKAAVDVQRGVADLLRGRRELYQYADGQWGGSRQSVDEWKSDLVTIDSKDWRAIRHLSVNPGWNVIAIDGRQTVFAANGPLHLNRRAAEASRLWFFLEWPNPRSRVQVETFLEPGLPEDSVRISGVFNAMRLPYAALRVLPENSDTPDSEFQRAWSYTELAVRSARQNGRISLLDQIRARLLIQRLRSHQSFSGKPLNGELERLSECLDTAMWLCGLNGDQVSKKSSEMLRYLLAAGEFEKAKQVLAAEKTLPDGAFLQILMNGLVSRNAQWMEQMKNFADEQSEPTIRSEARFYLGCRLLEQREIESAIEQFAAGFSPDDAGTEDTLSLLYLTNLTR